MKYEKVWSNSAMVKHMSLINCHILHFKQTGGDKLGALKFGICNS